MRSGKRKEKEKWGDGSGKREGKEKWGVGKGKGKRRLGSGGRGEKGGEIVSKGDG